MEALFDLSIPILLATVVMFIASSIAWLVLPHHRKDRTKLTEAGASMRRNLLLWFLNLLLIAALTGYLLFYAVPPEASYGQVFRIGGTALVLGLVGMLFARPIWWGWQWSSTLLEAVEGVVYAVLAAGVFGWWWVR